MAVNVLDKGRDVAWLLIQLSHRGVLVRLFLEMQIKLIRDVLLATSSSSPRKLFVQSLKIEHFA